MTSWCITVYVLLYVCLGSPAQLVWYWFWRWPRNAEEIIPTLSPVWWILTWRIFIIINELFTASKISGLLVICQVFCPLILLFPQLDLLQPSMILCLVSPSVKTWSVSFSFKVTRSYKAVRSTPQHKFFGLALPLRPNVSKSLESPSPHFLLAQYLLLWVTVNLFL